MTDEFEPPRRRLLRQTYCLLFGLACGGLVAKTTFWANALSDFRWSGDDVQAWAPGIAALLIGWIVSPRALRRPQLHQACRWVGSLGTIACLISAGYWFVQQTAATGWDRLEPFVFTVLSLVGAGLAALIGVCGILGRRYLATKTDGE